MLNDSSQVARHDCISADSDFRIKAPKSASRKLQSSGMILAPQRSQPPNASVDLSLSNSSAAQTNGFASAFGSGGPAAPQQGFQFQFGGFGSSNQQGFNASATTTTTSTAPSSSAFSFGVPSGTQTSAFNSLPQWPATPATAAAKPTKTVQVFEDDLPDTVPQWVPGVNGQGDGNNQILSCRLKELEFAQPIGNDFGPFEDDDWQYDHESFEGLPVPDNSFFDDLFFADPSANPSADDEFWLESEAAYIERELEAAESEAADPEDTLMEDLHDTDIDVDRSSQQPSTEAADEEMASEPMDERPGDVDFTDVIHAPTQTASIFSSLANNSWSAPASTSNTFTGSAQNTNAATSSFWSSAKQPTSIFANNHVPSAPSSNLFHFAPALANPQPPVPSTAPTNTESLAPVIEHPVAPADASENTTESPSALSHPTPSFQQFVAPTKELGTSLVPSPIPSNMAPVTQRPVLPMDELIASIKLPEAPSHFNDAQKSQFAFAYKLRCLEHGLRTSLRDAPPHVDLDTMIEYYNDAKAAIYSSAGMKRKAIDNGPGNNENLPSKRVNVNGPSTSSAASRAPLFGFPTASKRKIVDEDEAIVTEKKQKTIEVATNGTETPAAPPPGRSIFDRIEMDDRGNPKRETAQSQSENTKPTDLFSAKSQKPATSTFFGQSTLFGLPQNSSSTGGSLFSQPTSKDPKTSANPERPSSSFGANASKPANPFISSQDTVDPPAPKTPDHSPEDRTWSKETPIKFGTSPTSNLASTKAPTDTGIFSSSSTYNIFGQAASSSSSAPAPSAVKPTTSVFAQPTNTSTPETSASKPSSTSNIFGHLASGSAPSTTKPSATSIFSQSANLSTSVPSTGKGPSTSNIFGSLSIPVPGASKTSSTSNIFGNLASTGASEKPSATSSLFGQPVTTSGPGKTPSTSSLFGQPPKTSVSDKPSATSSPFGQPTSSSASDKPSMTSSLFGQPPSTTSAPEPSTNNSTSTSIFSQLANSSAPTSSTTKAAPSSSIFGQTPSTNTSATGSTTQSSTSNIFAHLASKPTSSTLSAPSLGFTFGGPSHSAGSSLNPSVFASVNTSRATSPGITTGEESNAESDKPGDDTSSQTEPQLDLSTSNAGEEDEDLLFHVKAKASELAPKHEGEDPSWLVRGVGELRVLKNRSSGTVRVVLRAGPTAKVVLNTALLGGARYDLAAEKMVNFPVASANGGLRKWLLQVGKKEDAVRLVEFLEESKKND